MADIVVLQLQDDLEQINLAISEPEQIALSFNDAELVGDPAGTAAFLLNQHNNDPLAHNGQLGVFWTLEQLIGWTPANGSILRWINGQFATSTPAELATELGAGDGSSIQQVAISSSGTLSPGTGHTIYACNTSAGALQLILPSSLSTSSMLSFVDGASSGANGGFGTNQLELVPANGQRIAGFPLKQSLVLDSPGGAVQLCLTGTRWQIISQISAINTY